MDATTATDDLLRDKVSKKPTFIVTEDNFSAFQRQLLRYLEANGMYASDLARKTGMSRQTISTYFRGRHIPGPDTVKRLLNPLGFNDLREFLTTPAERLSDARTPVGPQLEPERRPIPGRVQKVMPLRRTATAAYEPIAVEKSAHLLVDGTRTLTVGPPGDFMHVQLSGVFPKRVVDDIVGVLVPYLESAQRQVPNDKRRAYETYMAAIQAALDIDQGE